MKYEDSDHFVAHLMSVIFFVVSMIFMIGGVGGNIFYWVVHPEEGGNANGVIGCFVPSMITLGASLVCKWVARSYEESEKPEPKPSVVRHEPLTIPFRTILLIAFLSAVFGHFPEIVGQGKSFTKTAITSIRLHLPHSVKQIIYDTENG